MGEYVKVTCVCEKSQGELQLSGQLPADTTVCACNSCRYSTGVLFVSCATLASKPQLAEVLKRYDSSDKLSRYFCDGCGSHMLVHELSSDSWSVCMGVIDGVVGPEQDSRVPPISIGKIMQHEFVGDTHDGGLSICLGEIDKRTVPFYLQGPDQQPVTINIERRPPFAGGRNPSFSTRGPNQGLEQEVSSDDLAASCHCGLVQFFLTRPDEGSRSCSSPWPDLLVPYHSSSPENPQGVKWWLSGEDKYLAGTCACRSCRLASGSPVQAWAFVPKSNIFLFNGEPLDFGQAGLRRIQSSPGCFRESCTNCGATAFWHCEERPELIDVSVGLLRAKEGARAETWLDWWTERVSFAEEAIDRPLIDAFESGLRCLKL